MSLCYVWSPSVEGKHGKCCAKVESCAKDQPAGAVAPSAGGMDTVPIDNYSYISYIH